MSLKNLNKILSNGFLLFATVLCNPLHAQGPLGLGVIVGDPTGLSAKYKLTESTSIDAAAAWSLGSHNVFGFHADYLLSVDNALVIKNAEFPLHYGLGAIIVVADDVNAVGLRFPVGLSYLFDRHPIELFTEIAGLLLLAPDTDFDIQLALGARYYF